MLSRFDICMARLDTGGQDKPASPNKAAKPGTDATRKQKAATPGIQGRDMAGQGFCESGTKRQGN